MILFQLQKADIVINRYRLFVYLSIHQFIDDKNLMIPEEFTHIKTKNCVLFSRIDIVFWQKVQYSWQISITPTNFLTSYGCDCHHLLLLNLNLTYYINAWQNPSFHIALKSYQRCQFRHASLRPKDVVQFFIFILSFELRRKWKRCRYIVVPFQRNRLELKVICCLLSLSITTPIINYDQFFRWKIVKKNTVVWLHTMSMHNSWFFFSQFCQKVTKKKYLIGVHDFFLNWRAKQKKNSFISRIPAVIFIFIFYFILC